MFICIINDTKVSCSKGNETWHLVCQDERCPWARPGLAQGQLSVSRRQTHVGCIENSDRHYVIKGRRREPLSRPSALSEGKGQSADLLPFSAQRRAIILWSLIWVWTNNLEKIPLDIWSLVQEVVRIQH